MDSLHAEFINQVEQLIVTLVNKMQSLMTFTFVVFVAVSGAAQKDDNCTTEVFDGNLCCDFKAIFRMRQNHTGPVKRCLQKGASRHPSPPGVEKKNATPSFLECLMVEEGLLNADNQFHQFKVDRIYKFLSHFDNDAFIHNIHKNLDKCLRCNQTDEDSDLQCQSSSTQFIKCFHRESFFRCPDYVWSYTKKCKEMESNIKRCPEAYVTMSY